MYTYTNKLNETIYHLENGNENLGFRMLVDAVLDTQQIEFFHVCIAIAAWHETHEEHTSTFISKAKDLVIKLQQHSIPILKENSILVSAKDIAKTYPKNGFSLGPISLDIVAGQLIGLVGENGNGKTTLLRMLSKDLALSEGSINYPFSTQNMDDYALRCKLTYIPQRTPKWFGKVKDNLKLTATHYGISPNENEAWVLLFMIRFGLWKFRNHAWHELSSGYKMRFELARTFLRKPKLLLLDEPLANLDILSQQLILEDLKLLGKSLSNPLGIVLSSQQLYEVEKVSDEVIFLKNGKPSSFNQLKNNQSNTPHRLIVEIEIQHTKEELVQALQQLEVVGIKFIGSNYYIEMENCTSNEFLQALVHASIPVQYFRDISFSTRQFFHA